LRIEAPFEHREFVVVRDGQYGRTARAVAWIEDERRRQLAGPFGTQVAVSQGLGWCRFAVGQRRKQRCGEQLSILRTRLRQQLREAFADPDQLWPGRIEKLVGQAIDAWRQLAGEPVGAIRGVPERVTVSEQQVETRVARRIHLERPEVSAG